MLPRRTLGMLDIIESNSRMVLHIRESRQSAMMALSDLVLSKIGPDMRQ